VQSSDDAGYSTLCKRLEGNGLASFQLPSIYTSIFSSHATTEQKPLSFLSQKYSIQVVLFYSEQELLIASCRHSALFSYF